MTQGLADPLFAGWDTMPLSTSVERRRALLDAIARKQHELQEFERRRDVAKHSLEHLTAQLEALDGPQHDLPGQTARTGHIVPLTGPEKVALFRSLFRGRDDVFPVLWTSSKTGRTGYSPACSNEWTPGGSGGAIVNVSSIAALYGGIPGDAVYAASKGAVDAFTRGLAKEVAGEGIRVCAVRPGLIRTEMWDTGMGRDGVVELGISAVPMQRIGESDEIAAAVCWLCSDEASYMTGAIVNVSGGRELFVRS